MRTKPLTETLRELNAPELLEAYPPSLLNRFSIAVADRGDIQVTGLIGFGADSLAFELADGNVFKLGARRLFEAAGCRAFDLPIFDRGEMRHGRLRIQYYVQPRARTPVSRKEYESFLATVRRMDFMMVDDDESQLGIYEGKVLLLDPWAVEGPVRR